MFCHKCGTQINDGSVFCPKCGAKIMAENAEHQLDVPISVETKSQQSYAVSLDKPPKKKSGKLPLILGVVVLVIIGVAVITVKAKKQQSLTVADSEDIVLSETYTNDMAGISFAYPAGWKILDSVSEFQVVDMIDSKNNADSIARFEVRNAIIDAFEIFTEDEASIREAVNETATFLGLWDTSLGDVPAKCLMSQIGGLKGDSIVKEYWYKVGEDIYMVTCSYSISTSDIYEPIFDAIMDSYTITYTDMLDKRMAENTSEGEILYKDIPVSSFFDSPADVVAEAIGLPLGEDQDDDIRLYISDTGEVSSIEIWNTSTLTIDGVTLNRNRDGLVQILGEPYEEDYGGGYYMRYYFPSYSMYFELGEPDSVAWRVSVSPSGGEESTFSYDATVGFSESLEYYSELSGSYEGSTGQSSLSISIYSSQEDGETAIGTVWMYADDEQYYLGEIIAEPEIGVYLLETDTGEEVVLDAYSDYGTIVIDLYMNGQYIDEYTMVEHYES